MVVRWLLGGSHLLLWCASSKDAQDNPATWTAIMGKVTVAVDEKVSVARAPRLTSSIHDVPTGWTEPGTFCNQCDSINGPCQVAHSSAVVDFLGVMDARLTMGIHA